MPVNCLLPKSFAWLFPKATGSQMPVQYTAATLPSARQTHPAEKESVQSSSRPVGRLVWADAIARPTHRHPRPGVLHTPGVSARMDGRHRRKVRPHPSSVRHRARSDFHSCRPAGIRTPNAPSRTHPLLASLSRDARRLNSPPSMARVTTHVAAADRPFPPRLGTRSSAQLNA